MNLDTLFGSKAGRIGRHLPPAVLAASLLVFPTHLQAGAAPVDRGATARLVYEELDATAAQAGNHYDRTCPGAGTTTFNWDGFRLHEHPQPGVYVSADGRRLPGTASNGGGANSYTWDLTAADPQP